MNSKKIVLFAAALAGVLCLGSTTALAQRAPASEAGLIGRRHAGFDFTYEKSTRSGSDYLFGIAPELNLPLNAKTDLTFGYALAHTNGADHSVNRNALHASLLAHQHTEYGTGYFSGTLGQGWNRTKDVGVLARDDDAFWGVAAGYEVPVGPVTAFNAGLSYRDAFRGNLSVLQYRVEINHWFSREMAGVASASYQQIGKAPDALLYTIGLRWSL